MEFRCANNSVASLVCVSSDCSEYAFQCPRKKCCPSLIHANCQTMKIEAFVGFVHTNFDRLSSTATLVSQFYSDLISEIERDAQDFEKWVQKQLKVQKKLVESANEGAKLTGKELSGILKRLEAFSDDYSENIRACTEHWQKLVKNQLQNLKEELLLDKSDCRRSSNRATKSIYSLTFSTKMFLEQEQKDTLLELINPDGAIREMNKIYTASENSFSVSKFHQLCDGMANTLVLIKNSKGKLYGGYTPCKWESHLTGEYKIDTHRRSFVFDLNNGIKYPVQEEKFAIECHSLFGPIFGRGGIIMVSDKADKIPSYWQEVPLSYMSSSEEGWTKEKFADFMGTQANQKFTLVEWEVFQLIYE